MKVLDTQTKFAHLGKPGTYFTKGFQRRLDKILKVVDLEDKKILDMGCGEGVWTFEFAKYTKPENVFGSDFDEEQIENIKQEILNLKSQIVKPNPELKIEDRKSKDDLEDKSQQLTANNQELIANIPLENFVTCPGEALSFEDNTFDIVFHNEVLEHVQNDQKTINECLRVLKPGGLLIFFTPNTLWPFEQHGMFFRGKYYWGNIPLLPYMPNFIYKKFAPHVRNYGSWTLRRLFLQAQYDNEVVLFTQVFSGFDGLVRKFGFVGKSIQKFVHFLEKTPLHIFGISHFVIVTKK